MHLQSPNYVYVGNVNARTLRTSDAIAEDLASNVANGVRWYDSVTVLEELGCHLFLEMTPGHVLTQLAKEAVPSVQALALGETSLEHVLRVDHSVSVQRLADSPRSWNGRPLPERNIGTNGDGDA
jgi:malonyl CoA-acyl carrier protein transacylase